MVQLSGSSGATALTSVVHQAGCTTFPHNAQAVLAGMQDPTTGRWHVCQSDVTQGGPWKLAGAVPGYTAAEIALHSTIARQPARQSVETEHSLRMGIRRGQENRLVTSTRCGLRLA